MVLCQLRDRYLAFREAIMLNCVATPETQQLACKAQQYLSLAANPCTLAQGPLPRVQH